MRNCFEALKPRNVRSGRVRKIFQKSAKTKDFFPQKRKIAEPLFLEKKKNCSSAQFSQVILMPRQYLIPRGPPICSFFVQRCTKTSSPPKTKKKSWSRYNLRKPLLFSNVHRRTKERGEKH